MAAHVWVAATSIRLSPAEVAGVVRRGVYHMVAEATISLDVIDCYCAECRRSFADARDTDCPGGMHGGPDGRRRRKTTREVA